MRKLGLIDLALMLWVSYIAVVRTPVGHLLHYAVLYSTGNDATVPSLLATFQSGYTKIIPTDLVIVAPPSSGSFPEPFRSAAATLVKDHKNPPFSLEDLDRQFEQDQNIEKSIETLLLGAELVARATSRARSVGLEAPHAYETHRTFLPPSKQAFADEWLSGIMSLGKVLSLTWPVQGPHRISSKFGYRDHPTLKKRKFHNGVDLAVPIGTELVAAQGGKVAVSSENKTSGQYVIIDHGNGLKTSYCHLSKRLFSAGDEVKAGQLFALSGNTGRSTGPHLHFIVKLSGQAVDPLRFKPTDKKTTE